MTMAVPKYTINLDPSKQLSPLAAAKSSNSTVPANLPAAKHHHTHTSFPIDTKDIDDPKKLSIYFIGTVCAISACWLT